MRADQISDSEVLKENHEVIRHLRNEGSGLVHGFFNSNADLDEMELRIYTIS